MFTDEEIQQQQKDYYAAKSDRFKQERDGRKAAEKSIARNAKMESAISKFASGQAGMPGVNCFEALGTKRRHEVSDVSHALNNHFNFRKQGD